MNLAQGVPRVAMDQRQADEWWRTFEVNVLGVYNTWRSAAQHLKQTNGHFIAVSSIGAQIRWPGGSDYQVLVQMTCFIDDC